MVTKSHFRELVKHIPKFLPRHDLLNFSLVSIECHLAAQPLLFRRLRIDMSMSEAIINHLMSKGAYIRHLTLEDVTMSKFNAAVCLLSLKNLEVLEVSWCHQIGLNWLCRMVAQNKSLVSLQVFLANRYLREERHVRRSTYPSDPVPFALVDWQLYQLFHVLPSTLQNLALFQPHADITFATLPLLASKFSHRLVKLALASAHVDTRFVKFLVHHLPLLQSLVITASDDPDVREFVAKYNEETRKRKLVAALSLTHPSSQGSSPALANGAHGRSRTITTQTVSALDKLTTSFWQDPIEFFPDVECLSNSDDDDDEREDIADAYDSDQDVVSSIASSPRTILSSTATATADPILQGEC
ncbi:hypothetical protein RI367_005145 [Sorochytrium milnesiophthora]